MNTERYNELRAFPPEKRLLNKQESESFVDRFCCECGVVLSGYAIMKYYCETCSEEFGCQCSACGCDAGNGAGGYSNCCGARETGKKIMRVGLIESRHEMPVESYLLKEKISEQVGYHQELYNRARSAAFTFNPSEDVRVDLYITGLSVAVLGAVRGFMDAKVRVVVRSYDRYLQKYLPTEL